IAGNVVVDQVGEMYALALAAVERQGEHLVEVAVVDKALPVDRDQVAAHHAAEGLLAMRVQQKVEGAVELALREQGRSEALDRHVGEREQVVEHDAVALAEDALVVGLERGLRGRQRRSLRVVDEIERQPGLPAPIAERVETPEAADRGVEHALAALTV